MAQTRNCLHDMLAGVSSPRPPAPAPRIEWMREMPPLRPVRPARHPAVPRPFARLADAMVRAAAALALATFGGLIGVGLVALTNFLVFGTPQP